ncbi:MAG: hypothetical protein NTX75_13330 [Proteobacteria bacterium]|nr:hypothetical protein [Pseudomonadota bacterium]
MKSNGVDWITTSVVKAHGLGIVTDAVLVNIHELLREEFSEHQLSATALRSIAKKLILDMVPETKAKE